MHVLVLPSGYPSPRLPLAYVFFAEQAQAFARRGVEIGVVYPELCTLRRLSLRALLGSRFQVETSVSSVGIHQFAWRGWNPGHARLRHRLFILGARRLLRRYIRERGRPDLIHCQGAIWGGVAGETLSREFDLPFVVTLHSSEILRAQLPPWKKTLVAKTLAHASRVFAVGQALATEASRIAPSAEVEVCPNFINTEFFTAPERAIPSGPLSLLAVGRLISLKGHDVLLRALARSQSDANLRIAGAGAQGPALRDLAEKLGLAERVRFLGQLDREQLRQEYERAHALVHPSRLETFGVVLVEALATGLPVVATACGGPQEILTPELGYLVPPDDVVSLSRALDELQATYATRWAAAGPSCRAAAVERYSDEALVSRLRSVYREVTDESKGSSAPG